MNKHSADEEYKMSQTLHTRYILWYVNKHSADGEYKTSQILHTQYYIWYVNKHSADEVTNITYPVVTHRSENII